MVRKESEAYKNFLLYMRGWKHGTAASAELPNAPDAYRGGYRDGTTARRKQAAKAQKHYRISDEEIMLGVLR